MWHIFWRDANFHEALVEKDIELGEQCRLLGCPRCGGVLHRANYPRLSCGMVLPRWRSCYEVRISFCCASCRRRITPKSVRFFGRRWYAGWTVLLVSMLERGPSHRRCKKLRQLGFSVSESTWQRWRRWWRHRFERTRFWASIRGFWVDIGPSPRWPRPLLAKRHCTALSMRQLLHLLGPLTVPFALCLRAVN